MSDTVEVGASGGSVKRLRRTAAEKRQIVEATLVPGASIARVAREHGVNANQVFQWRHEYRKGTLWAGKQARTKLLRVTVAAEPSSVMVLRSCRFQLRRDRSTPRPGRALVTVESGVDADLARAVLGSLLQ